MAATRPLALVTGGSSGIGFELAKHFAQNGFDLVISGSSDKVERSAEEIKKLGVECFPHRADAATYEGVQGLWDFVVALNRPLEAAALNVGIGQGGAFIDNKLEDDFKLIAINITGTVHMAKRVAQHMVANGKGRILITSSISATQPTPYETVYGPSKAFGFSFAESLREELRDTGVTVTALLPGATDSEFHKNAGMANSAIGESKKNDKTEVARQGFEALMNDVDHVVGGDEETKRKAIENRTTPEVVKAQRHAKNARLK
ncbi:SDR family NAD(P)-dependent oxidoreductase [Pseudomonas cichorii]|uniref:SDR family NAD(P)-dependent oxidoreductase n=1 Tax=Pseudomonas lijiangensis TaxID=2995658 RepID=A0ABX8HWS5_9PSED|nr:MULTISPECIES: SDR family NAD(P)-dependent oxidoreductase [Pseudomonas syringae group]MBX8490869.1 SDR family NAD(P)-dependent oxidoreductase [Pseudomonas cichorii]MBX8499194.1 SDR family NAD(P)-dependent oxidoreductase [Pseudomonas lijiangensis]MBX8504773.1 SDR family NAD(P)-dependent oxidoreductase [Pseudomonas lijiangensis]MBX8509010.1 SDR family NAD(P)-dependent oxidoreductase [Pseudomonas cichorii]MBX8518316.1 SDR family NAD(P)-dependent oxidoreductase [Pseudomonas cichorii]